MAEQKVRHSHLVKQIIMYHDRLVWAPPMLLSAPCKRSAVFESQAPLFHLQLDGRQSSQPEKQNPID